MIGLNDEFELYARDRMLYYGLSHPLKERNMDR